jgi:hypothetical protein
MLAAAQDDGSPYPDYDGFTLYNDPESAFLRAYAERMDNRDSMVAA